MTYWRLYYHLVWGTKKREAFITPDREADIHHLIIMKAKELDGIVYAINGMPDHIHMAVSISPQIAISDFVKRIKGSSSHSINQQNGDVPFQWQPGFGVVSFGQKRLDTVVTYIEQQKEHHQHNSTWQFLEEYSRIANGPPPQP